MVKHRASLRDIADQVGVHTSTVSRVLNPDERHKVSDDLVERVTAVAKELGYRPNPLAYGLKTNRTGSIGVVVPDITNPVFPETFQGIEDVLIEAGYMPFLANTDHDADRERAIVENMRDQHVDGLIIASGSPHVAVLMACKEDGVPLVLIHRTWDDPEIPSVSYTESLGARLMIDHLVGLGHRDIAYIAGPLDSAEGRDLYFGTKEAIKLHEIPPDERLFAFADSNTEDEWVRCCREVLLNRKSFTALLTAHDNLAAGCLCVLAENGLVVPHDISLAGYSDTTYAAIMTPSLTSIRVPYYDGGVEAARLLINRIENPTDEVRQIKISPRLIARESTAAPRALV